MTSRTVLFWSTQAVGAVIVVAGVVGLLSERLGEPGSFFSYLVGSVLVHDLVLAPLVFGLGWLCARVVPGWAWPPVRNAGFATVVAVLFSWPAVRGYGRRPTNPSILPRDYVEGLLVVLAVVWVVTGLVLVRARRRAQPDTTDPSTSRMSSP